MPRALLVILIVAMPAVARAYPQFQFATGSVRCNECHLAPAGGGLLDDYGRQEAGDTISAGGDGGLLHGLVTPPSWLALGGDARVAGLVQDDGDRTGQARPRPYPAPFPRFPNSQQRRRLPCKAPEGHRSPSWH